MNKVQDPLVQALCDKHGLRVREGVEMEDIQNPHSIIDRYGAEFMLPGRVIVVRDLDNICHVVKGEDELPNLLKRLGVFVAVYAIKNNTWEILSQQISSRTSNAGDEEGALLTTTE